jgi:hypothetical protein
MRILGRKIKTDCQNDMNNFSKKTGYSMPDFVKRELVNVLIDPTKNVHISRIVILADNATGKQRQNKNVLTDD